MAKCLNNKKIQSSLQEKLQETSGKWNDDYRRLAFNDVLARLQEGVGHKDLEKRCEGMIASCEENASAALKEKRLIEAYSIFSLRSAYADTLNTIKKGK